MNFQLLKINKFLIFEFRFFSKIISTPYSLFLKVNNSTNISSTIMFQNTKFNSKLKSIKCIHIYLKHIISYKMIVCFK